MASEKVDVVIVGAGASGSVYASVLAKAGKKVFVFFGGTPKLMTVKLAESHGHASSIEGVEPTGYGLGASGWLNVPVDAPGLDHDLLCEWIEESYRIVAPKRLVAELDRAVS